MKTKLLILLLPLAFVSCDFLDKFDHFSAGSTFDKSFTVNVGASETSFSGSAEFNATDDETISENIDRINDYKLKKLSFKITSYDGPSGATGSGQFSFSSLGSLLGSPIAVSNVNFGQLQASGDEVEVPLTDEVVLAVRDAYLNNQTITVEAGGEVSDSPITMEFTVYMSIEARVNVD